MKNHHSCNSIEELRAAFSGIPAFHGGDSRFMAQALMFLAERSVAIPPRTRKPSEWNKFFAKGMKDGKAPGQIAREWKERRAFKVA